MIHHMMAVMTANIDTGREHHKTSNTIFFRTNVKMFSLYMTVMYRYEIQF